MGCFRVCEDWLGPALSTERRGIPSFFIIGKDPAEGNERALFIVDTVDTSSKEAVRRNGFVLTPPGEMSFLSWDWPRLVELMEKSVSPQRSLLPFVLFTALTASVTRQERDSMRPLCMCLLRCVPSGGAGR